MKLPEVAPRPEQVNSACDQRKCGQRRELYEARDRSEQSPAKASTTFRVRT
jgi:hypothetical protein